MDGIKIDIAVDFNDKLGGRYIRLGPFSGEAFYLQHLKNKFELAKGSGVKLHVYLDGTNGYGSSFLDESFGRLARDFGVESVNETIDFHTEVFSWQVKYLKEEIWGLKK